MKKIVLSVLALMLAIGLVAPRLAVLADSLSINFEAYVAPANIDGQDGWSKTGSYDVMVVPNTYGFPTFGLKSLRMSDAVTSGGFGDQTFARPLLNAVGEADSTDGTFSRGTLQSRFEMQFDLASTLTTLQSGMHVSVSPDRGDGSRMSYLRLEDQADGIHIFFDDVPSILVDGDGHVNFVETDIATVSRTPHTIKLTFDAKNGPSNDVVSVYVDGLLKITGTSWENYYRYDIESVTEQSPRIVKTVLFRESGTANPLNLNNGFLVDNLTLSSGPALPAGLIGYWAFDEGAGFSTADSSGNNHNGTLVPSPVWAPGVIGTALRFNASDNHNDNDDPRVVIGRNFDVVLPFTLTAWINPVNFTDWRGIFSKRDKFWDASMRFDVGLSLGTGRIYVNTYRTGLMVFDYAPTPNTWTHIAIVASTSGTTLYVNGVAKQTRGVLKLGTSATANTVIGGTGEGPGGDNDPFNGLIDEVRVYNKALSSPDVQTIFGLR